MNEFKKGVAKNFFCATKLGVKLTGLADAREIES
jgi:hypothetical protein